jgi:predicted alpha/beta-hydrolase family hydrolase
MKDHVKIPSGEVLLDGELIVPQGAQGIVLFAHGSGSSRNSPRDQFFAAIIRKARIGALRFDLLTREEEAEEATTTRLRFDIGLLAKRFLDATRWIASREDTCRMGPGYFGAGTDAAAALSAAGEIGSAVHAVVSRGGRPDLAGDALSRVLAPTLLIVGALDPMVHRLNAGALAQLQCEKKLVVVAGASDLFEEAGKLNEVAYLSAEWFRQHLRPK